MSVLNLHLALSGPDPVALLRAAASCFFPGQKPAELRVDMADRKPGKDWLDKWAAQTTVMFKAQFGDDELRSPWLSYLPGKAVKLFRSDWPRSATALLDALAGLPFELASCNEIHREWVDAYPPAQRTTFADGHIMHGWMCAFKGSGHERLVSRRWLEFGPWKLHRGPADTSLVQFHQLDADWKTALAQARPGHRRMGISDQGGFIQTGYVYSKDLKGGYIEAERRLRIMAMHRDVPPVEMLDAAAMKHYQVLGKDQPLDAVAFLFDDEERARRHLHELWLRGLECWVFKDGRSQRLDDGYAPGPQPPAWTTQGS